MFKHTKKTIKTLLAALGYEISRRPKYLISNPIANLQFCLEPYLRSLLYDHEILYALQIGAYDGISNDPLHRLLVKHPINAILVEPNNAVIPRLVANYSTCPNVLIENAAVADKEGVRLFYSIYGEGCPWEQLSSFSLATILTHLRSRDEIEKWLHEDQVVCTTISALLKKHQFPRLDLLVVDVEGFESVLLRSIDFSEVHPNVIFFESCHLSEKEKDSVYELLYLAGYKLAVVGGNTLAIAASNDSLEC